MGTMQSADALTARNGVTFDAPISSEDFYLKFGDSWRVSAQESLFDYAEGTTTNDFTDKAKPAGLFKFSEFSNDQIVSAMSACQIAGRHHPFELRNCLLDVLVSDDAAFADIPLPGGNAPWVQVYDPGEPLPADLQLSHPQVVQAGETFEVSWTSFDPREADLIAIFKRDVADNEWDVAVLAELRQPAQITAPGEAGEYEVHYQLGGRQSLANSPLLVEGSRMSLSSDNEVVAGSFFPIYIDTDDEFGKRDYVTIVPVGTPDEKHNNFIYVDTGERELRAPDEPGAYELRYVAQGSRRVLARSPVSVSEITATLNVPSSVPAGSQFEVVVEGPNNKGDYVTIVPVDFPDGQHAAYFYADRSSRTLRAPDEPGDYEVRYVTNQSRRVLDRQPIEVTEISATLTAPEQVIAGAWFDVDVEGPNNLRDFVSIAQSSDPAQKYVSYFYADRSSRQLRAPENPGEYEVRYVTNQSHRILDRITITVVEGEE